MLTILHESTAVVPASIIWKEWERARAGGVAGNCSNHKSVVLMLRGIPLAINDSDTIRSRYFDVEAQGEASLLVFFRSALSDGFPRLWIGPQLTVVASEEQANVFLFS